MNHEVELINAIIDSDDMPLALAHRVDAVFDAYQEQWDWIRTYYNKFNQLPDKQKIKKHFPDFDFIQTKGPLEYYIQESHAEVSSRRLRMAMREGAKLLEDGDAIATSQFIASKLAEIMRDSGRVKDTDLVGESDERVDKLREQIKRAENGESVLGIPSGIEPIDYFFGGWQPGDMALVMGYTGSLKSWLARLFAVRAWKKGYVPLVVSLEMNKFQEGYRFDTLLNQGMNFKNSQLSHGRDIDPNEYEAWVNSVFVGKQPFHLITNEGLDSPCDQNLVDAKIGQYSPDLVVLDYIGLFEDSSGATGDTEALKRLSKDFKRLAVKHQVPIIVLSQVTMKDNDPHTRAPMMSEIAWSKGISFDCDLVLSIFKNPDTGRLDVESKKNRRGEDFAFELEWDIDAGIIKEHYGDSWWDNV